ncbi:hypothetical protein R6Q59_006723 [Mikania micrantha]
MSKRGKRGVASCKKRLRDDQMYIEFDENQLPIGPNSNEFDSKLGLAVRSQFPYWVETKKIEKEKWKDLWFQIKELWHIPNDDAEKRTMTRAKKMRTDFLSKLYRNYIETGENPCTKYKYFDSSKWEEFVASRSTDEALAKSAKARLSALSNQNPARTGRSGYRGLKKQFDKIWASLVESNPHLKDMKDVRSKLWVAARRRKNPQTGKYDIEYFNKIISNLIDVEKNMKRDGSYGDGRSDPLTQIFGPEHGGRTRTVSGVVGRTQLRGCYFKGDRDRDVGAGVNMSLVVRETVDPRPDFCSFSGALSGSPIVYPDVENVCKCELLWSFSSSCAELVLANGQAYPSCDRYLNDDLMHEDCVKVHVDYVRQEFLHIPVPEESKKDGITFMKDAVNMFIQWPKRALKILNVSTNSASQQLQTPSQTHEEAYMLEFTKGRKNAVEKPQSRQLKPKQTRAKQSKAKGNGKQVGGKSKDKEKQVEKVKVALEKIKIRPKWYQNMVSLLQNHIGNDWATHLHYSIAAGMFPTENSSSVLESKALLQLFVNECVDLTIMFWFTSYFYEASSKKPNPCAFLNANTITGDWCKFHRAEVEEHISSLYSYHGDKYFLAPYLANGHWTLFIIAPKKAQVYILDPLKTKGKKDQSCYLLSQVIQSAFNEVNFTWTMIPCKQQTFRWECGYMVIKYMFDYVLIYQEKFPDLMWQDSSVTTDTDVENLLKDMMPQLFSKLGIC